MNFNLARSVQLTGIFVLLVQERSLVSSQCARDQSAAQGPPPFRQECASAYGDTLCGNDCSAMVASCNTACGNDQGGRCGCSFKPPIKGVFGSILENGEVSCRAQCEGLATIEDCDGQPGCKWSGDPSGGFNPGPPQNCVDTRESCQKCVAECKKVNRCRRARDRAKCKENRNERCKKRVCNCDALDDRLRLVV